MFKQPSRTPIKNRHGSHLYRWRSGRCHAFTILSYYGFMIMPDSYLLPLRHIQVTKDSQEILWAGLDMVHSTVNRLSTQMLSELNQLLDYAHEVPPAGLIIYSAKTSSFIVGADIDEFAALDTPE